MEPNTFTPPDVVNEIKEIETNYVRPTEIGFKIFNTKISRNIVSSVNFCQYYLSTCKFTDVVLYSNQINTVEEFKNLMQDGEMEMYIGGSPCFKFAFSLLMELCNVIKSDNFYKIQIPSEWTTGNILLGYLEYYDFEIKMCVPNAHVIDNVKFITDCCFYNRRLYIDFLRHGHEKEIGQIFKEAEYIWGENTNQNTPIDVILNIHSNSFAKGHLIEGDISKIDKFGIILNGHERFSPYNNTLLQTVCYKISDNLHYFSFTNENNLKTITTSGYVGGTNYSSADDAKFDLKLKPATVGTKLKIYTIGFNLLRYLSGMAGTAYTIYFDDIRYTPFNFRLNTSMTMSSEWTSETRPLDPNKKDCPITQELITKNYALCNVCMHVFDYDALNLWLTKSKNCPTCRSKWKNHVKYTEKKQQIEIQNENIVHEANSQILFVTHQNVGN